MKRAILGNKYVWAVGIVVATAILATSVLILPPSQACQQCINEGHYYVDADKSINNLTGG